MTASLFAWHRWATTSYINQRVSKDSAAPDVTLMKCIGWGLMSHHVTSGFGSTVRGRQGIPDIVSPICAFSL